MIPFRSHTQNINIRGIIGASVAFCLCFVGSLNSATLHWGPGFGVPLSPTKTTSPTLMVNYNGNILYAPLSTPVISGCLATAYNGTQYTVGNYTLYRDYSTIGVNACNSISLPPGSYKVEVRGGTGGNGGSNTGGIGADARVETYTFVLYETTTAQLVRGANGNSAAASNGSQACGGSSGNCNTACGGGASGMASALIVNGNVYKSEGGMGGTGGSARDNSNDAQNCGGGGGGGGGTGLNGYYNYWTFLVCGGGGGGAPNGIGGASNGESGYIGTKGNDGTLAAGGSGGTTKRTLTNPLKGGDGGASVSVTCGSTTLYSYGGGGGSSTNCVQVTPRKDYNGAPGASGTTGSSSTSYIKIYKAC